MNCKRCGVNIPDGKRTCPSCGADNGKMCVCGSKNSHDAETCEFCGRTLDEHSSEQKNFFGNDIPRNTIPPLQKIPAVSKDECHFSTALNRTIIATGLFLVAWLCFHMALKSIGYDGTQEFQKLLSRIQWMRFSTLAFSFSAFTIILFDKVGSIKGKIFTALCVVVFFIISWYFLFPSTPELELLEFLYEI